MNAENQEYVSRLAKENINLKIKNTILLTKHAVYDLLFDYMKLTNLWFHSFIMFFSSLQQSSPLPTSLVALSTTMFTFPDKILKIHEEFINQTDDSKQLLTRFQSELNHILEYDKKNFRETMNTTFENINDYKKNNQMFENFLNLDSETKQMLKIKLKIKNDIELEPFVYNLKKIDILWNLVGSLFGKTPYLAKETEGVLKEFNVNFSLEKFVLFFSQVFEKEFNCILNNRHKFYLNKEVQPVLVLNEPSAPNIPDSLITEINLTRQNHIYTNLDTNFVDKHVNIAWFCFLEKVFKQNKDKTNNFFETAKKKITKFTDRNIVNVILQNLHCNKTDLVRNSIISVYKENFLLKQLLVHISVKYLSE
jgi:hypothetical protein